MTTDVLEKVQKDGSLAGRVAIVTGSTSGIGLGIARALASEGAVVVLNGLGDRVEIDSTCQKLSRETGNMVRFNGANLLDPAEAEALVTDTIS
ncbi:MAG TPA: SDR family NAD(P)-dependent oxidoreductase, partial [Sphingorhabdus sp.]|nr:SDR family NAD(P)-dependent oxidoreductase [Sphingorhabdus sp.]